tara:strand:+ start:2143 stop:2397 length:255 start_codon:yes stop_codon:yes gene_type:complete
MKEKINVSIDGRGYTKEVDKDLNSKAYGLFGTGIGKDFLSYLESITTNNIYPAGVGIETLAHAEGSRWLVAVIKKRTEQGRKDG